MNATNKRKVPEDAPTEFVSKTIRPLVVSDGVIDKHAWECALIRKIRDEIFVSSFVSPPGLTESTPKVPQDWKRKSNQETFM